MKVAITGGTGFVGGHLAEALSREGHEVVVLSRGIDQRPWAQAVLGLPGVEWAKTGTGDVNGLVEAFAGCQAVAHCAGINREIGTQTYEAVHIRGTTNVVQAAERTGVERLAMTSFLRARPACGSAYHESKWAAEELVRSSGLEWTVLKSGMMFGLGDHMLDHLSHAMFTFPIFFGVGKRRVRPLAVDDAVVVLRASLVDGALPNKTVGLLGPTELTFDDAAAMVGWAVGRRRPNLPLPIAFHYALAWVAEKTMTVPLVALAQVRILQEEVAEAVLAPDSLPIELQPRTPFSLQTVSAGLPTPGPFTLADLRWLSREPRSARHCRAGIVGELRGAHSN